MIEFNILGKKSRPNPLFITAKEMTQIINTYVNEFQRHEILVIP